MERKSISTVAPSVSAYYDALAADYDTLYTDPVSRYENAVVRSVLHRLSLAEARVLDLGCGTGLFLDLGLCPRDYLGLDVSAGMIAIARQKHPSAAFCVGDMTAALPERYDAVVSLFGAASHLLHRPLADLLRPLRPGGHFCLMVFAAGKGDRTGWRYDRACPHLPPLPVRYYSAQGLRQALPGMEAVRVRGLNACLSLCGSPSSARWMGNALLERLRPSRAALLIATGRKPGYAPQALVAERV